MQILQKRQRGNLQGTNKNRAVVWLHQKRISGLSMYTQCGVIWNEGYKDLKDTYYESGEYRKNIDGNSEIASYREKYDSQVLWHLELTGTDIFRDKNICDIGCGGGSFLDFINTPAKSIIAIEPNQQFHSGLREQGYSVYPYTSDALKD